MTEQNENDRRIAQQNLFSRLSKLWSILKTVDVVDAFVQLDARQRKLEQSQHSIKAMLAEAATRLAETETRIEALMLQRPDPKTIAIGMLDIKNLGYELGRQLAAKNLAEHSVTIDHGRLKSKLCTQDDFERDWLLYWCRELRCGPIYHRKIWELCYVSQVLFSEGQLEPGRRGICFGCGTEPLPSLFAKYGAIITATDLDQSHPEAEVWQLTAQHASTVESLRRPDICPDPEALANIEFRAIDMNDIPSEFDGQFDFCWSTCALEHLGTLAKGMEFIENSVRVLKPGGLAVHTTEFTLDQGPTIDNHPIVLYQRGHFEDLAARLRASGHDVMEFNFDPGGGLLDRFVDLPPYFNNPLIGPHHSAHLKLVFDGFTCTSAGIIVKARP
jgi:SAM-dependent methyltransferase